MPRFDGTGPFGTGPHVGGRGGCLSEQSAGCGLGFRRGFGRGQGRCGWNAGGGFGQGYGQGAAWRGYNYNPASNEMTREEEVALIEQQIIALQTQLATLKEKA
ncbi:MAG: DUF5320 domain-containing protein [Alphaproteobacteria bacterium]|jgi:hypothetical protein|nr:DUF5320 domain-containing protein [Alphaproteobacteria bacterium]